MDRGSIYRRLFALASPIIGLNVLNVLALAIDTAMCGRLPNAALALKALGYATQVVFLLMVLMMGLAVGSVALVARAHGAGLAERVSHVVFQSSQLTVILSVVVAVAGNLAADVILELLGASDAVQAVALDYLRPILTLAVLNYLNILYAVVLRGVGNTRLAFMIALGATAVNVVANYGLILGNFGLPALGVRGAAIGTVLSHAFSVVAMIVAIRRGVVSGLFLPLRPRPVDRPLAAEILRVGTPAALDMVILNASFMAIIGMLGRIDEDAVAAHGIGIRIQALAFVPGMSISQATGAMIGQALGAGDTGSARQVFRASVVLCVLVMGALGAIIVALSGPIVGIFDVDPASGVGAYSVLWMKVLGYAMPIFGVHVAFIGLLQGSGATQTSLRINFLATIFVQIPLSAILAFPLAMAAFGVWISFPIGFVIKTLLEWVAYRSGRWARVGAHV